MIYDGDTILFITGTIIVILAVVVVINKLYITQFIRYRNAINKIEMILIVVTLMLLIHSLCNL